MLLLFCQLEKKISNSVTHQAPCSLGLSATSQQYFSLRPNQPPATSQQYYSLRTNQHQPSATSQPNRLKVGAWCPLLYVQDHMKAWIPINKRLGGVEAYARLEIRDPILLNIFVFC
jgi:hypothetical protein